MCRSFRAHFQRAGGHTNTAKGALISSIISAFHLISRRVGQIREKAAHVFQPLQLHLDRRHEERQEMFQPELLGRGSVRKSVESRGPCLRDP